MRITQRVEISKYYDHVGNGWLVIMIHLVLVSVHCRMFSKMESYSEDAINWINIVPFKLFPTRATVLYWSNSTCFTIAVPESR